jgi:hypothetical protein
MTTQASVLQILANPFDYKWTIQGFGMLRTYLDSEHSERLHIWDPDIAVPEVSTIHDHPWDFTSRIFLGQLRNQRYVLDAPHGDKFTTARVRCGAGGGLIGPPRQTVIGQPTDSAEHYGPGDMYSQEAPEFHESFPSPGTVTVITRSFLPSRDIANMCWRTGQWVSGEPRPATREEIEHFVSLTRLHGA